MTTETYPRLRNNSFNYNSYKTIPSVQQGRLDLFSYAQYNTPFMNKVIGAANKMRNIMMLRPGIRKYDESVRNELILKGYTGDKLEQEYNKVMDDIIVGDNTWISYDNNVNGVITEAILDKVLLIPSYDSMETWYSRYNTLQDI